MKRKKRSIAAALAMLLAATSIQPIMAAPDSGNPNLALHAAASGENTEGSGNTYDKAVDGSLATRFASAQDTKPILRLDLGSEKEIGFFRLYLEERNTPPKNNVAEYKITISKDNTYDGSDFSVTRQLNNTTIYDEAKFSETVTGRYVQLEVVRTHGGDWDNAAIVEFELYKDVAKPVVPTYNAETNMVEVPEEAGWTITNNGTDYEQIVDDNFHVTKPLTEKTVKLALKKTNNTTGEEVVTSEYAVTIPGVYKESTGNEKPNVIPELAEWYSDSTEEFTADENSRIVVHPDYAEELSFVAGEFKADYEDKLGKEIEIVNAEEAEPGDFYFTLGSEDTMLGEEGYRMEIADSVSVEAVDAQGSYWATRTLLQILTLSDGQNTIPYGVTRDYPKYETRGFILDVGRKACSMDMLEDIVKNMLWYKMNDFQVHLTDNLIFMEDYGIGATEDEALNAYAAYRLESGVKNEAGETATSKDYAYTKAEFRDFIQNSRKFGMNIVPEIDVPAHALAITKVFPEFMIKRQQSNGHPLIDHIDISNPEAVELVKDIFDDYTTDTNPTFDSETVVHVGADEFLTNPKAYRDFVNELIPHIKETNTVRMWGGLTRIKDNPVTQIVPEAVENVQINLWSKDWADGIEMYKMGYQLINTIDDFMYMVPNGGGNRGAYGDYLNTTRLFNDFEVNKVRVSSGGYQPVPAGDEQMSGVAFAIWNDNIDTRASGLTETDLYARFEDALPVIAEKGWAEGKEKGTVENLQAISDSLGTAPNSNPYIIEDKKDGIYAEYTFEAGKETTDTSGNGRMLTDKTNVTFESGKTSNAVKLAGGASYIESPLVKLGTGNTLSFDMKLQSAAEGQILFEADSPYGTHDIRIVSGGRIGFTRESYEYAFDGYQIPIGQWVRLTIKTENQKTSLYVDNQLIGTARGRFLHSDRSKTGITNASFALPLQRIGSETNAVKGLIDNVTVNDGTDKTVISNEGITVTATSEYQGEGAANLLDGNTSTIWHSDWSDASQTLPQTLTFTFPKATTIERITYVPRSGNSENGNIMGFKLTGVTEDGKEVVILENQTWAGDASTKSASFDAVTVTELTMTITASKGDRAEQQNKFASGAEITFHKPLTEEPDVPEEPEPTLKSIQVTAPTKTEYEIGEELDLEGMKVTAIYSDDTTKVVTDKAQVNGFDSETAGEKTITVTYEGKTATFKVTVKEAEEPEPEVTPEKITVKAPTKTEYEIGEELDLEGMVVTATYSDKSTEDVTDEVKVTGFDSETAGEKTITVTYEGKTATFKVTVKEAEEPKPPVEEADKEALNESIKAAEELKAEDYTEDSWKVFAEALEAAKKAAADEEATQEAVDAAADELAKAMDALEKAEDVPNPPVEELFEDVRKTDWYYDEVAWAYENDIMKGYDNVKAFGPVDTLKRAQFAQIMYNLADKPEVEFEDVLGDVREGDWYAEPVVWAYNKGIITGYEDSGLFGASDPITREQIATILYRYADKPAAENQDALKDFPDADKVSGFAKEAMLWAVEQGIITGDKGNLNPGGNANRAETAAMMQRAIPLL